MKYLSILILAGTVDYLLPNDPTNILMPKVRLTRYFHAVVAISCNESVCKVHTVKDRTQRWRVRVLVVRSWQRGTKLSYCGGSVSMTSSPYDDIEPEEQRGSAFRLQRGW